VQEAISEGDFYSKFLLKNKDGFTWALYAVYGSAQDGEKVQFLAEMAHICSSETHPMIIDGDFNIMRFLEDKNKSNFCPRWPSLSNSIIDTLELREIKMTVRQFTWSNNLVPPTFEKLDRVLMSTEWEWKYPRVIVQALDRGKSDHNPLLLNTGTKAQEHSHYQFKFELGWLICDGFFDMVTEIWQRDHGGESTVEIWQNKIRAFCQYLRG
jgi:hypothetical protein